MILELDHLIVLASPDAPEGACLVAQGILEGPPNVHPGQGTACRRYFFDDVYLELLYVTDPEEARRLDRIRFLDRWQWRRGGACPLGFVFRGSPDALGLKTFSYAAPYLPIGMSFEVVDTTAPEDPMVIFLPKEAQRFTREGIPPQPFRKLLDIRVGIPGVLGPVLERLSATKVLEIADSEESLMDLCFAEGPSEPVDARPMLPLRVFATGGR